MKKLLLSAAVLATTSFLANAKNITLEGNAAESFIARHFPNAEIPGAVKGTFKYVNRHNQEKRGYAECFVPAMGGHSRGEVSVCEVIY